MDWRVLIVMLSCLLGCVENTPSSLTAIDPEVERDETHPEGPLCSRGALPKGIVRDQDFLSFPNFGYRGIGRCRGHALLSQRLLYFMRFDPNSPRDWDCSADAFDCQTQLLSLLEAIQNHEVVTVRGYRNLQELSSELPLRSVLRSAILRISHRYSATPIQVSLSSSRQAMLFREMKRRVRLNHLTYVVLKGEEVGAHGVLIYKLQGSQRICVRDPNIIPANGVEECQSYFTLVGEDIFYTRAQRGVSKVVAEIFSDEEVRLNSFRQSLCQARRQGSL